MKKYGDMTDADLDTWQMLPGIAPVLISRQMGAWLERRDERRDEQEKKTGRWIYRTIRGEKRPCCSECGEETGTIYEYRFCPNCGSRNTWRGK